MNASPCQVQRQNFGTKMDRSGDEVFQSCQYSKTIASVIANPSIAMRSLSHLGT
jgi:hypothetical protein